MDKLTEIRQSLGRKVYDLMKKYGDTSGNIVIDNITFYVNNHGFDNKYCTEYGFKCSTHDIFGMRKYFNHVDDAVSPFTTTFELETCIKYLPIVEEYLIIINDEKENEK